MSINDAWVKGWPNILAKLGYGKKGDRAVKRMAKLYGFPLMRLPSGEPAIIMSDVNAWLRAFSEVSSPFRLQELSGAALRASNGEKMGIVATQKTGSKYEKVDWDMGSRAYAENG